MALRNPQPINREEALAQRLMAAEGRLSQLEAKKPIYTTTSFGSPGEITTSSTSPVVLPGGPELQLPAGPYLVGLSIFMQSQAAGVTGLVSTLCNAGTGGNLAPPGFWCWHIGRENQDGAFVTNCMRINLSVGIPINIYVWSSTGISALFDRATIWAIPSN